MHNKFIYLKKKLAEALIINNPFPHIEIKNFFSNEDFSEIVSQKEISIPKVSSDKELLNELLSLNYKMLEFPGSTTSLKSYLEWHKKRAKQSNLNNNTCSGVGITLRLTSVKSKVLLELTDFFKSEIFINLICDKFKVDINNCELDFGIQKYLDGYEISPHPDVRRKALTFMINVNPSGISENNKHHTQLLKFKDTYKYIETFWKYNENIDRCWVPWDWCDLVKNHISNNSIIIFAPNNNSLHAVKADYNHYDYQRTQLYGNLWYKNFKEIKQPNWEAYKILGSSQKKNYSKKGFFKKITDKLKKKSKFYNF